MNKMLRATKTLLKPLGQGNSQGGKPDDRARLPFSRHLAPGSQVGAGPCAQAQLNVEVEVFQKAPKSEIGFTDCEV